MRVEPLEPRRVRYPKGAYGWVDLRIVTDGHLESLDPGAALTYLFLCAVGNREGVSFWSRVRMSHLLHLPLERTEASIQALVQAGLIVATERVVQVLPVPDRNGSPPAAGRTRPQTPTTVPGSSTSEDLDVNEEEIRVQEPRARSLLARLSGNREPRAGALWALARSLALRARSKATSPGLTTG